MTLKSPLSARSVGEWLLYTAFIERHHVFIRRWIWRDLSISVIILLFALLFKMPGCANWIVTTKVTWNIIPALMFTKTYGQLWWEIVCYTEGWWKTHAHCSCFSNVCLFKCISGQNNLLWLSMWATRHLMVLNLNTFIFKDQSFVWWPFLHTRICESLENSKLNNHRVRIKYLLQV